VATLDDSASDLGRPLDTFLLDSHNFMVTALGSVCESALTPLPVSLTQPGRFPDDVPVNLQTSITTSQLQRKDSMVILLTPL